MVIEKLDALESALTNVMGELDDLRRSRGELETQLEQVRSEARTAADAVRSREQETIRLQEENARLLKEHSEIRDRVERILNHLPRS